MEGKCLHLVPCVAMHASTRYTKTYNAIQRHTTLYNAIQRYTLSLIHKSHTPPLFGGRTLQDHWRPRCNDVAHLAEWAQLLADLWGAAPLESELLRRWEYQGGSLTADPRQQA